MALRGDLASVDLAQVFQMLAMNQKVGLLSIQSKKLWKVLYFDHRGVTVHHNVHAVLDRVVAGFVRAGRLSEDALEEVRDHAARMGQPLTDSLLAGGFLGEDELDSQYRIELEEELYELFFCRDARFEFFEAAQELEGYDGVTDDRFLFNCDSVVMEAARRIDEWAYIVERVPSDHEFYVPQVDSIPVDDYGAEGAAVFELLDGRRSVDRVVQITGLARFPACKAVSIMLDAGVIAPVAEDELPALAAECVAEGRIADAIQLYERATSTGVGGPELHSLAAQAYQTAELYEDAARHLGAEAEGLVAEGDVQAAAERLSEIRRLLPTALSARERLVELTLEHDVSLSGLDAMAEGKELVDLLLEFGDIERVRTLLERLLLVAPDDLDLKKALVSVHVKAGDQPRVVELYESIADDLVDRGTPLEAVAYLQKILLLDRGRSDISHRVRELYEHDERNRRRTRSLGVLAFLFCALVVLGAFYWFYNERAAKDYASIDVRELLAHDDFAGAEIAYKAFIAKFPLTTAGLEAEAELQQVEAARQRFEAKLATEKAERERKLQRIRDEYRREWKLHREQFLGGEPEKAIKTLNRVRDLLATVNGPEDVAWALEHQVERNWQRLNGYVVEADKLAAEYRAAYAANEWQRAREIALELEEKYENTSAAAGIPVPVMVKTRPSGARLMHRGKPLERTVDGRTEPLITPALVLCADARNTLELTTDLEGFEPGKLLIDPREQAEFDAVLAVIPERRITFPTTLQTGIAVGQGWLAVGLRGGKLGIGRTNGTSVRVLELPGLKEVAATPVVAGGHAFFISNEGTIECLELETASLAKGWPVALPRGAATALTVGDGRVAIVDGANVLHCWEQRKGLHVWSLSLDSPPSGPPTIHRRQVLVGTNDGRVLIVDAADGKPKGVLRSRENVTTRVLTDGKMIVFGCASGLVRAVDLESGKVMWDVNIGQPVADGSMAIGRDVVCCGFASTLMVWHKQSGETRSELTLEGAVQPGLATQGQRLLVRLQRPRVRNLNVRDALQAVDLADSSVLWGFEAAGIGHGVFGVDELSLAFPGAADEVVMFR